MTEVLKPILENDLLNEEAKAQIQEAFEAKLSEARHDMEVQLREEAAARYEHDKDILVQAVERMVDEGLKAEMGEFHEDRMKLTDKQVQLATEIREARIDAKNQLSEQLEVLEQFVLNTLRAEMESFAEDREAVREAKKDLAKQMRESRVAYKEQLVGTTSLLEKFVLNQLSSEISSFQEDKQALVTQRVKMISEGKEKIEATRKEFIKRASGLLETKVTGYLQDEMSQFKEDIQTSREKAFGQNLFNEYAAEFKATFFNESAEIRELNAKLDEATAKSEEAAKIMEQAQKTVLESEKRQRLAENQAERTVIMSELLNKLSGPKQDVMSELLEGVKTKHLKEAFKKYVPAVTSSNGEMLLKSKSTPLTEGVAEDNKALRTGNRKNTLVEATEEAKTEGDGEDLSRVLKLAGI